MSKRRWGVRLSEQEKAAIRADLEKGYNAYEIAERRGVSKTAVYRIRDAAKPAPPPPPPKPRFEFVPDDPPAKDPRDLYRREKARREERLAVSAKMQAAKEDFAALLQREREAGRGGRPKKIGTPPERPGKPRLFLQRDNVPDLGAYLGEFHGLCHTGGKLR